MRTVHRGNGEVDVIRSVHERRIDAPALQVAALLATLGGPRDAFWRTCVPDPMVLDGGLVPGSLGGHGGVRYRVVAVDGGDLPRRVVFAFEPATRIDGTHSFEIDELPDGGTVLRHTLIGQPLGGMRLAWPLVIRSAHDEVIEDIHDHVEQTLTGTAHRGQRPSRRIRLLLRLLPERRSVRAADPGERLATGLLAGSLPRVDAADTWVASIEPGDARDARRWEHAAFGAFPPWVGVLMRLRDLLVGPLGLVTASSRAGPGFPELAVADDEVLIGMDDRHLSFRVSVRTEPCEVSVTTTVQVHNGLGRLYWSVVRWFHPVVVRAMLARVPRPVVGGAPASGDLAGQAGAKTSTGR